MSSASYLIVFAIIFVVVAVAVLTFAKIKMKDRHHSVEDVMFGIVSLLILSFGWIITIPTLIIVFTIYFCAKYISKWLNR